MRNVCPICDEYNAKVLFFRDFSGMKNIVPFESYSVKLCNKCGMIYAGDINSSQELSTYYTKFSKYDTKSWIKYEALGVYDEALDMICKHVFSEGSILDIGCGSGTLLRGLKNRAYSNLVGVDPSDKNCQYIRDQYGIESVVGSLGEEIQELHGRKFDCITLTAVLEHLVPVRKMIEKACGYLKPGGIVFFNVPDIELFSELPDLYQQFSVEHVNYFSIHSLKNLMKTSGLRLVEYNRTAAGEINSIWKKDNAVGRKMIFDTEGYEAMKQYLSKASELGEHIKIQMKQYKGTEMYVWGAGTHTAMLYQLGAMKGIYVKGIIDSNEHYHGVAVFGHEIMDPEKVVLMEHPIVISSQIAQSAIKNTIRSKLCLNNPIIELYD